MNQVKNYGGLKMIFFLEILRAQRPVFRALYLQLWKKRPCENGLRFLWKHLILTILIDILVLWGPGRGNPASGGGYSPGAGTPCLPTFGVWSSTPDLSNICNISLSLIFDLSNIWPFLFKMGSAFADFANSLKILIKFFMYPQCWMTEWLRSQKLPLYNSFWGSWGRRNPLFSYMLFISPSNINWSVSFNT